METMNVICAACDKEFAAPREKAGARVKCPGCSAPIELPDGDGVAHALGSADDPDRVPVGAAGAGRDALPPVAIAAAIAAGIAGALIWAGITVATNYEIGYVAWAVGGMVGGAAMFMGAAGRTGGIVCGVIALVAIAGGRYVGTSWTMAKSLDEYQEEQLTPELHAEYGEDARLWQDVDTTDTDAVGDFMVERDYISPPVSDVSVEEFLEYNTDRFDFILAQSPDLDAWRAWEMQGFPELTLEAFKESFGLIDLLFAFLGISTAFGLVAKRGEG